MSAIDKFLNGEQVDIEELKQEIIALRKELAKTTKEADDFDRDLAALREEIAIFEEKFGIK